MMMAKSLSYNFVLLLLLFVSCESKKEPSSFEKLIEKQQAFDLLVTGASIVDGTGIAPFKSDILVSEDSIAFIGEVDESKITVDNVVDGTGQVLSPGFIDTHAHGNPLGNPQFKNFVGMGVTTICLGQDGFSPEVESLTNWINEIETNGITPNIAMFTGHSTIRILSGIGYRANPDSTALKKMGEILLDQLNAGSFGLTTGLEYTPGTYANAEELTYLAKITGKEKGILMSHMRNEDNDAVEASIQELLALGKYCPVHASHLKVVYGKGTDRAKEIQLLFEKARKQGIKATADIYPYTASFTGIGIVFPKWAKLPNNYDKVKAKKRPELLQFIKARVNKRNGPSATLFGTKPYVGKKLEDVANEAGKPFEEVLVDDIGPQGASAAYFVMNETLQTTLLQDELTMLCSDGSPTMNHPRGYGSFSKMIAQYVVIDSIFTLQEAVRKMTSLPAATLGIQDRGEIKKGKKADLILFNPTKIETLATFENPFQTAKGFDMVWINGKLVKQKEDFLMETPGKVLRK